MKRSVTIQVAGQKFSLKSDLDDRTLRDVAEIVEDKIRVIRASGRLPDTQQVAVLAALQLAEELYRSRKSEADLRKSVRDRSRAILDYIEREARV